MIIKKIKVLSLAKVMGAVYGAIGLIAGAVIALMSMLGAGFAAVEEGAGAGFLGLMLGVGAIILAPLFYGTIGFIGGLFAAFVYNLVSSLTGGLELEVE